MPTRVRILQWIIQTIAVSIKGLGVGIVGYYGVRADETSNYRIVVAGVVEVETGFVQSLAGEKLVRI